MPGVLTRSWMLNLSDIQISKFQAEKYVQKGRNRLLPDEETASYFFLLTVN